MSRRESCNEWKKYKRKAIKELENSLENELPIVDDQELTTSKTPAVQHDVTESSDYSEIELSHKLLDCSSQDTDKFEDTIFVNAYESVPSSSSLCFRSNNAPPCLKVNDLNIETEKSEFCLVQPMSTSVSDSDVLMCGVSQCVGDMVDIIVSSEEKVDDNLPEFEYDAFEDLIPFSEDNTCEPETLRIDSECKVVEAKNGEIDDFQQDSDSVLKSDLTLWSLQHKIGRNALTDLLEILRNNNHPTLPKSSKTLLKTPRSTVNFIKKIGGGIYWYYGILNCLKCRLRTVSGKIIEMDIFADGVSPFKSVKRVVWPICGCLVDSNDIFIIAIWVGQTKEPGDLEAFLEDFIKEAEELVQGFIHEGEEYALKIHNVIADAPARAWLKNVNQHGSYYACERCTVRGQWNGRITYHPREEGAPRTDQSLREMSDKNYHKGFTPFLKLGINLITQFPLDSMHLISGVMKRILSSIMPSKKKTCKYKLSEEVTEDLNKKSCALAKFFPSDFGRKPRPLTEWALYKAKEFRRLLLYDGFLILKNIPSAPEVYSNYLLLACSIRILSDPILVKTYSSDAYRLLKHFVVDSCHIYGQTFIVYNVHHLPHIVKDCELHGELEKFSAFKYENYLGIIKQLLHAPGRTLSQIVCRILERIACLSPAATVPKVISVIEPHQWGPTLGNLGQQFSKISLPEKKFFLSARITADSFCLTIKKEVVKIENIMESENGDIILIGRKFMNKSNFFSYPFYSSALDIYEVHTLGQLQTLTVDSISRKVVLLPINPETSNVDWSNERGLCLPMPHSDD